MYLTTETLTTMLITPQVCSMLSISIVCSTKKKNGLKRTPHKKKTGEPKSNEGFKADWSHGCDVCGQTPVLTATGMCAVCTFGEADAQFELIELGEL